MPGHKLGRSSWDSRVAPENKPENNGWPEECNFQLLVEKCRREGKRWLGETENNEKRLSKLAEIFSELVPES